MKYLNAGSRASTVTVNLTAPAGRRLFSGLTTLLSFNYSAALRIALRPVNEYLTAHFSQIHALQQPAHTRSSKKMVWQ